ncbi:MAG: twin-arginine translocase subunit TatC [Paracoccaceae bacterium]
MEHLVELRTRIIHSLIAFLITMSISFYFADDVFNFLSLPIISLLNSYGQNTELIYTGLQQGFMVHIKISIFSGFLFAFPFISFQLWRFVAPGMYKSEKKAFLPFLISSPLLFILGAAFAFYVVMPLAFDFLLKFQQNQGDGMVELLKIKYLGSINEYLSLTMAFIIAFGLSFQLPVLLTLLGKVGLVTSAGLASFRKYAAVAILILAALVTPPDVITQIILFSAVYTLYEISIFFVKRVEKGSSEEL